MLSEWSESSLPLCRMLYIYLSLDSAFVSHVSFSLFCPHSRSASLLFLPLLAVQVAVKPVIWLDHCHVMT
jgi:hypothetical protein